MRNPSKGRNKKRESLLAEDGDELRRSLRLRLKASKTSPQSSRKLSQKKRRFFNDSPPLENSSKKVPTNLREETQKGQSKSSKSRGKVRNNNRASQKDKVKKEAKSSNLPVRKISKLTTKTRHPKVGKLSRGKSKIRKTSGSGSQVATIADQKSTKIQGLKKTSAVFLNSFTTERHDYTKQEIIRFCDVAFLDDNHIVALDDNFIKEKFGHRICCFSLDGTMLCELPLPAHPWSLVVINLTEVVVSLRDTPSHGLIWLSVDVSSRSMEIMKHITLDEDCYGLAFNGDIFAVTYLNQGYISLLNTNGEEIGRIPVSKGTFYHMFKCIFREDQATLLYLDHHENIVQCINLDGQDLFSLEKKHCSSPIALSQDNFGNIYVGNWDTGNVSRFTKTGKFEDNVCNASHVCGLVIDHRSDLMAVAHKHFISVYRLLEEETSQ